jgi:hypothetical protein
MKLLGASKMMVPMAVSAFFPTFSPLLTVIYRSILQAEKQFPAEKSGAQKAAWAVDAVAASAPEIIAAVQKATGNPLANEALLKEAMSDLNNGMVKAMNAFKVLDEVR